MTYSDLKQGEHQIVGITVIPVDLDEDARPTPMPDADTHPQYVCQICWQPLHDIDGPCPGPKIPDNASSLEGN